MCREKLQSLNARSEAMTTILAVLLTCALLLNKDPQKKNEGKTAKSKEEETIDWPLSWHTIHTNFGYYALGERMCIIGKIIKVKQKGKTCRSDDWTAYPALAINDYTFIKWVEWNSESWWIFTCTCNDTGKSKISSTVLSAMILTRDFPFTMPSTLTTLPNRMLNIYVLSLI